MSATIAAVRAALESGAITSRSLVQGCLERAEAGSGEGARAFVTLFADSAIVEADAIDQRRRAGIWTGPLGGIPISVKDLFDIRGMATTAGSVVLAGAPPAAADAVVVARLRAAGAVIVGRTNMTEFAFSGLGLNPHFGTPANPYDRLARRIPGGSSSGAAVSVCDGTALGAIGTDTGGSLRIPAALCGLVGFKPTAARVPSAGTVPLSISLDSIGPLGRSVQCCRILDAVLSDQSCADAPPASLQDLRIAVPTTLVLDGLEAHVGRTFESALATLADAGARISRIAIPEFADVARTGEVATFSAVEGYSWHRQLLERARDRYDPRVAARLEKGRKSAADYLWLLQRRSELKRAVRSRIGAFDVLAAPTVPIIAPLIADLDRDEDLYHRVNLLVLRNPALVNFLDGCALSLPCHEGEDPPVGLMLARFDGADHELLAIGEAVECALAARRPATNR